MARKEVVVEEVQRLMSNIEQIRNVAIVAHVDHGKCVSGGARLSLSDGRIISAKDLYKELEREGVLVEKNKNETVYKVNGPHVFSLNKESQKIERRKVTDANRLGIVIE